MLQSLWRWKCFKKAPQRHKSCELQNFQLAKLNCHKSTDIKHKFIQGSPTQIRNISTHERNKEIVITLFHLISDDFFAAWFFKGKIKISPLWMNVLIFGCFASRPHFAVVAGSTQRKRRFNHRWSLARHHAGWSMYYKISFATATRYYREEKKRTTDSPDSIEEREIFLLQSNKFELLYQDKISWLVTMCVHRAHFHSTTAVLVFLVVFFAPWW